MMMSCNKFDNKTEVKMTFVKSDLCNYHAHHSDFNLMYKSNTTPHSTGQDSSNTYIYDILFIKVSSDFGVNQLTERSIIPAIITGAGGAGTV